MQPEGVYIQKSHVQTRYLIYLSNAFRQLACCSSKGWKNLKNPPQTNPNRWFLYSPSSVQVRLLEIFSLAMQLRLFLPFGLQFLSLQNPKYTTLVELKKYFRYTLSYGSIMKINIGKKTRIVVVLQTQYFKWSKGCI